MASFKDSRGKTWSIDITIMDVDVVRKQVGIDLLNPTAPNQDGASAQEILQTDLVKIYQVLHILCLVDCERDQISEREFGALLRGASLRDAVKAFWEAWSDFFRDLGREDLSQVVTAAYQTTVEVAAQSAARVGRIVDGIKRQTLRNQSRELDEIEKSLSRELEPDGTLSGTEPASSE